MLKWGSSNTHGYLLTTLSGVSIEQTNEKIFDKIFLRAGRKEFTEEFKVFFRL